MERFNLFLVQDGDRPMYVVAENWIMAIDAWKKFVANDNEMPVEEVEEPDGVNLVSEYYDLILPTSTAMFPSSEWTGGLLSKVEIETRSNP